ncbi:MAG: penicillin-binding protein 1B [gamma proteobacterium endosymbiont of Lamellibrachia anaximandri]|nr:penicillin-binding protein 1B [gamma proteobacterium endosymbiont of Lamellibrachia anaximandri]
MAKRRKKRGRGSARRAARSWRRWIWLSLAALIFSTTLYVLYLDRIVQVRFDGRRWAVPAQVYGRPLLLRPGVPLTEKRLRQTLDGLGYRRVKHPDNAGSYSSYKGRFLIRTRPFHFATGQRGSDYLEVRIVKGRVNTLKQAANGKRFDRYPLEPALIGSLHPAHSEDRVLLRRSELPELLVSALFAVEDRHFQSHFGLDLLAIGRALIANIRAGGVVQGGSTLTQQLVKNFFLTRERSLLRKVNEALMAVILEFHYSKDEILEAYVNEIYLGQDGGRAIHGFGLASQFYFNRPLAELDLPRVALLVALVRGPSAYDPKRHPKRALKRRTLVVNLMQEQGVISADQAASALNAPLGLQKGRAGAGSYPAFIDLVRRQLRRDYDEADLNSEGLRIFSTLDPWVQERAEQALSSQLKQIEKRPGIKAGILQGALVVADVETGEISALVGDRNPRYAGFNRALDAIRPVGSLIKPAVYLAALSEPGRYTLVTSLQDSAIRLKGSDGKIWSPRNYDRKSHGKVLLQDALAHSYNLATVRLGMDVGLKTVTASLRDLGVERPLNIYPSMLLGAVSLSPLEMAQMYQALATGGLLARLRAISAVTDAHGRPLSRYSLSVSQVADKKAVFLLSKALQQVIFEGTGRGLVNQLSNVGGLAGKTGTTDKLRDSWFAGFDRRRVAVVWVGRDNNKSTGLTGSTGAMRVWGDLMRRIGVSRLDEKMPQGVVPVAIDPQSGLLGAGCAEARLVPFIRGSAPTRRAECASARRKRSDETFVDDSIDWFQQLFR